MKISTRHWRQQRRAAGAFGATVGAFMLPLLAQAAITSYADVLRVIGVVEAWLFWLLMSLATIFIILAGYTFLRGAASPENITKAKNQIIYAVIAVVVAVLAKGLVNVIQFSLQ